MARIFGPYVRQEYRDALGSLLREARLEAGVQQQELAARVGVPPPVISKIEAGERGFDLLEARAVCAALGLTMAEFVRRLEAALSRSS